MGCSGELFQDLWSDENSAFLPLFRRWLLLLCLEDFPLSSKMWAIWSGIDNTELAGKELVWQVCVRAGETLGSEWPERNSPMMGRRVSALLQSWENLRWWVDCLGFLNGGHRCCVTDLTELWNIGGCFWRELRLDKDHGLTWNRQGWGPSPKWLSWKLLRTLVCCEFWLKELSTNLGFLWTDVTPYQGCWISCEDSRQDFGYLTWGIDQ